MALFLEMEDKRLDCDIVIYSILIDGFCNTGELTIAREIFSGLLVKGLHLDVWTYTIMIKGFCKNGLVDEASELLEKMDGNGCSPNEHTYNTIIHGFLQHRETSKAMKYLKMMVDKGFSANATTAALFIDLLSSDQVDKKYSRAASKVWVKVTEEDGVGLEVRSERWMDTSSLVERAMAMAVAQSKGPNKSCIAAAIAPSLSTILR
ncbi:pentatricopeptide repeat-containing protein At1g64100-like [Quercus robur]|uniref:pentatricopeptide repeat-containing protein At1g64100-like n=1 Tax=Quercus robur TaxID=38942 RepID=UPI0021625F82|nr:pentatricopeptide repeat-containing protein At1g64100-like [Quercus robur]